MEVDLEERPELVLQRRRQEVIQGKEITVGKPQREERAWHLEEGSSQLRI